MGDISVCRAAYLIPFLEILRDIGAPIERELELGKLPVQVEETPDDFISNVLAMEFLARSERRAGIDDLGWLWAQRFSSSVFSAELTVSLSLTPTIKARLNGLAKLIQLEDSDAHVGLVRCNGSAEVFCDGSPPDGLGGVPISEWTQVMVLIEVVRSIAGKAWSPDEIRFRSDFKICNAAREANPNTRFINQSSHTSIVFPSSLLAASKTTVGMTSLPSPNGQADPDTTDQLKRLLRPYLRVKAPKVEVLAEIAGTSPRTLQRKLKQSGTSYSELIETTRFKLATEMLKDTDARLVEIAMELGFENQSNFGRSFKRIAGISPGRYRRDMLRQDCTA